MSAAVATLTDPMVDTLDALCASLGGLLPPGFSVARDNPGQTPQTWTVVDGTGAPLLTFGLMDRTFVWTWDSGASNHYAKSRELMERVILSELARNGVLTHSGSVRGGSAVRANPP